MVIKPVLSTRLKTLTHLLLISSLASCASPVVVSDPDWFGQPSPNNYEVKGYGQATTLEIAKDKALSDIAQTLKVNINASTEVTSTLDNDSFNTSVVDNLQTSSSATLTGVVIEHSIQLSNTWYVSAIYDTGSTEDKFKRALQNKPLQPEPENILSQTKPDTKRSEQGASRNPDKPVS